VCVCVCVTDSNCFSLCVCDWFLIAFYHVLLLPICMDKTHLMHMLEFSISRHVCVCVWKIPYSQCLMYEKDLGDTHVMLGLSISMYVCVGVKNALFLMPYVWKRLRWCACYVEAFYTFVCVRVCMCTNTSSLLFHHHIFLLPICSYIWGCVFACVCV